MAVCLATADEVKSVTGISLGLCIYGAAVHIDGQSVPVIIESPMRAPNGALTGVTRILQIDGTIAVFSVAYNTEFRRWFPYHLDSEFRFTPETGWSHKENRQPVSLN